MYMKQLWWRLSTNEPLFSFLLIPSTIIIIFSLSLSLSFCDSFFPDRLVVLARSTQTMASNITKVYKDVVDQVIRASKARYSGTMYEQVFDDLDQIWSRKLNVAAAEDDYSDDGAGEGLPYQQVAHDEWNRHSESSVNMQRHVEDGNWGRPANFMPAPSWAMYQEDNTRQYHNMQNPRGHQYMPQNDGTNDVDISPASAPVDTEIADIDEKLIPLLIQAFARHQIPQVDGKHDHILHLHGQRVQEVEDDDDEDDDDDDQDDEQDGDGNDDDEGEDQDGDQDDEHDDGSARYGSHRGAANQRGVALSHPHTQLGQHMGAHGQAPYHLAQHPQSLLHTAGHSSHLHSGPVGLPHSHSHSHPHSHSHGHSHSHSHGHHPVSEYDVRSHGATHGQPHSSQHLHHLTQAAAQSQSLLPPQGIPPTTYAQSAESSAARAQQHQDEDEDNDANSEINSDYDTSSDDSEQEFQIVICQYDRVSHVRSKWKCSLKDGIMHINDKDYVFSKCQADLNF
eukprot:TRINITY_DN9_c0_g3_i1.p1 TRINITY_DN9_c0_g3~~TRINITY_DN9_c0_g3_i1.p1  ORF type:complete len:508 (+),score=113.87 TRINITY_DN9_c0_g3_i1:400-1923(+)